MNSKIETQIIFSRLDSLRTDRFRERFDSIMTENDVIFKEIMSEAKNELDEKMKVFKLEYKQAFEKKYNLQPGDFEYLHKSCGKE